jgi:hypothetical protein
LERRPYEVAASQSAVAPRASFGDQRAPLSVQDVEQVVVTPLSQAMHTATHCFMFLGLYGVKSFRAQSLIEPVTSLLSGVHETSAAADIMMKIMARMSHRSTWEAVAGTGCRDGFTPSQKRSSQNDAI